MSLILFIEARTAPGRRRSCRCCTQRHQLHVRAARAARYDTRYTSQLQVLHASTPAIRQSCRCCTHRHQLHVRAAGDTRNAQQYQVRQSARYDTRYTSELHVLHATTPRTHQSCTCCNLRHQVHARAAGAARNDTRLHASIK